MLGCLLSFGGSCRLCCCDALMAAVAEANQAGGDRRVPLSTRCAMFVAVQTHVQQIGGVILSPAPHVRGLLARSCTLGI